MGIDVRRDNMSKEELADLVMTMWWDYDEKPIDIAYDLNMSYNEVHRIIVDNMTDGMCQQIMDEWEELQKEIKGG